MDKIIKQITNNIKATGKQFNPIIITDIDGVLIRGNYPIPGTLNALRKIKQHKVPFACLTNAGGNLQVNNTSLINKIFQENILDSRFMFMSHSPLRPLLSSFSQLPGIILVSGSLNIQEILKDMSISNYVTADQLFNLFHSNPKKSKNPTKTSNLKYHERSYQDPQNVKKELKKRFKQKKLPENYIQWCNEIRSIFALNDISPYQTFLQVIHNVLAMKLQTGSTIPPYYAAQNDIVWAGGYHRPRLAFGPFNLMLKGHCQNHKFPLQMTYFGKPQIEAFRFVENYMIQHCGDGVFFMIGDNPRADIRGANNIGWLSFLTKTGIHQGDPNDTQNPASMVVQNFQEAIQVIFKLKAELSGKSMI